MSRPAILAVDDDLPVLRAVDRDLREHYASDYRVIRASSGAEALKSLRELQLRGDAVALLLVDQRMPEMTGVEFLQQAMELYPDARRVLLTAYADTDAAIRAINQVHVHNYLLKPWDPPEEKLYPVLDDLLGDWRCQFRQPFQGIKLIGTRWSPEAHRIRDFLSRSQVPFQWFDIEARGNDAEVRRLAEAAGVNGEGTLPAVVFEDGSIAYCPALEELAQRLGLGTSPSTRFYDLLIVGGGPAGLAAAVYGASEGLKTIMIEREAPGGQAGMSSRIENYLGFPSGLSGEDLARRAVAQARRFEVEVIAPQEVTGLRAEGQFRHFRLADNSEISCHAALIATGVQWRRLDVPGVERLHGAGLYYGAATTEAISCRNETVYVVGGANSAGQGAMHFSRYARHVVMLVRGDSLSSTMSDYLIRQIRSTPNIEIRTSTKLVEVHGEERLQAITLENGTGQREQVDATSLFIFIGAEPRTEWLAGVVERDEKGFILTGRDLIRNGGMPTSWTAAREPMLLETSVPGVFAVGDVRHGSVKRVASSVGEGAIAVQLIHQYLNTLGR